MVVVSLRVTSSKDDYCSPILCLGTNQRTPSPSLVAFYDSPGKVWAAGIFFVALLAKLRDGKVYKDQVSRTIRGFLNGRHYIFSSLNHSYARMIIDQK